MDTKKMAKVFKALSNPNRLELYLKIVENQEASYQTNQGCLMCEITEKFNIGPPTISHHLKELTNAGLISTEREGRFLVAKINEEMVDEVNELLKLNSKK
jgi:ArsR family transcriptional regulator